MCVTRIYKHHIRIEPFLCFSVNGEERATAHGEQEASALGGVCADRTRTVTSMREPSRLMIVIRRFNREPAEVGVADTGEVRRQSNAKGYCGAFVKG
jgi:hypothetical protein